ncbi:MAG TPA: hypothetical protein VNN79_06325 [Actinomycetota bacterium]|nr:hypothetical protein [Actinomycetota bacterium]
MDHTRTSFPRQCSKRPQRTAARRIERLDALRRELGSAEAEALIWALGNPDVYRFLSIDLGWTARAYRVWIERSLRSGLLRQMDGP